MNIIIVEDRSDVRKAMVDAIVTATGDRPIDVGAISWDKDESGTFEAILLNKLGGETRPSLVVSDHDLTQYDPRLTDNELEPVCQQLLIPLLRYARKNPESPREKFGRYLFGDLFLLPLSIEDIQEAARLVVAYYDGFQRIRETVRGMESLDLNRGHAGIMSDVVDRPEFRLELSLYSGSGPQPVFKHPPVETLIANPVERLTYQLGHWLLNSIMRFPGLLLDEVATAAYLDLDIDSFRNPAVGTILGEAEYQGPFSELRQFWWRPDLEKLLDDRNAQSGKELDETIENLSPSIDIETKEPGATYVCLVSGKPTTKENSVGNLNWIPQGATQSRINKTEYEKWAPYFSH